MSQTSRRGAGGRWLKNPGKGAEGADTTGLHPAKPQGRSGGLS
jgi:hypothetical protein